MGRIRPGRMGLRLVKAKERGVRRNTCALGIKRDPNCNTPRNACSAAIVATSPATHTETTTGVEGRVATPLSSSVSQVKVLGAENNVIAAVYPIGGLHTMQGSEEQHEDAPAQQPAAHGK